MTIPFIDLQAQRLRLNGRIEAAVQDAVTGGAWVMGPQVRQFEADLAAFGQAKHALGCANGTDALALPLMAWGIGRGDAVFVPSFTFAASRRTSRALKVFICSSLNRPRATPDWLVTTTHR